MVCIQYLPASSKTLTKAHYYDPLRILSRSTVFSSSSASSRRSATVTACTTKNRGFKLWTRSTSRVDALTFGHHGLGCNRMLLLAHGVNRKSVEARGFDPQNGGVGRTIFNLAGAGLLTYLTISGSLNWLFEALFSLWIFFAIVWWLAERNLIKGRCPNCGGEFQVFEFSMREEPQLCPYCSQPFKLENKQFVREEPQFSNAQQQGFKQVFRGFETRTRENFGNIRQKAKSASNKEKASGVVVDVEAEVRDKD